MYLTVTVTHLADSMVSLPWECIEHVMGGLAPTQRFVVATDLRLLFVQSRCLPLVTSVEDASERELVDLLEKWKTSGLPLKCSNQIIMQAIIANHDHILEWWKQTGLSFKYQRNAMDFAKHPRVLEWWKNNIKNLRYGSHAIDAASESGNVKALEWWKNSGLKLKYSLLAMDNARDIVVLDWWKNSGLVLKYTSDSPFWHRWVNCYHREVWDWWKQNGPELDRRCRAANSIDMGNQLRRLSLLAGSEAPSA